MFINLAQSPKYNNLKSCKPNDFFENLKKRIVKIKVKKKNIFFLNKKKRFSTVVRFVPALPRHSVFYFFFLHKEYFPYPKLN